MPLEAEAGAGDWLVALLRSQLAGLPLPLPPPADLVQAAIAEGLAGLAAEHLAPAAPGYAAMLRRRQVQFAHAARLGSVQRALGERLAAAGCEALLLKGAALLEGPYAGAVGRRPLSDLDLLIRPAQAAAIAGVFGGLGLRRLDPTRWRGDGFEIDLHQDLLGLAGQGLTGLSPFTVDQEGLWRRSVPAGRGGPALRLPAPADLFLHLAIHGQKHAFCRRIWLLDLALLLPAADPLEIAARAAEWRAERALAAALALLADPLGVPIPPALEGCAERLNGVERAWLAAIRRRRPGRPIGLGRLIAGFAHPALGPRLRYWLAVAWPGGRLLERKYRRGSAWATAIGHLGESVLPRLAETLALTWRAASRRGG